MAGGSAGHYWLHNGVAVVVFAIERDESRFVRGIARCFTTTQVSERADGRCVGCWFLIYVNAANLPGQVGLVVYTLR